MANFVDTLLPTPFGFFDTDATFQTEADAMVTFVKRKLGDDVLTVELTRKQIWACFEEATLEFGALINQYQAHSQLQDFLGLATGSLSGSEQSYPRETLEFLQRQAEPYSAYAGLGGSYNSLSGSITLERGRQDYDMYTELVDESGTALIDALADLTGSSGLRTKMRIGEVFHFGPQAAFRFFDSTSAINFLNNEFGFESFTPETIFYVLPVFEDILRAGQMDVSQRVRRSNYSYQIVGTKIRIFPTPAQTLFVPRKLWIRVFTAPDPLSTAFGQDETVNGVSNLSNIPFGNLQYGQLNSISRQWIREMTITYAMEILGWIRSKVKTIPVPGSEVTLNGDELIQRAREDRERLYDRFIAMLEKLTYDQIVEREADKSENLLRQLKNVPMPNGYTIIMG